MEKTEPHGRLPEMRRLSGGSVFDHNKIYHTSIETVKQAAAPYRAGPGCFLFGSLADSLCSGFCRCGFPFGDAALVDGIEDGIKDQEKKQAKGQDLQDGRTLTIRSRIAFILEKSPSNMDIPPIPDSCHYLYYFAAEAGFPAGGVTCRKKKRETGILPPPCRLRPASAEWTLISSALPPAVSACRCPEGSGDSCE